MQKAALNIVNKHFCRFAVFCFYKNIFVCRVGVKGYFFFFARCFGVNIYCRIEPYIDIKNWPAGVYYVKIVTEKGIFVRKVVREE